jgi:UTP:GlnB (protein PII) uridylyltransferase
LAPTVRAGALVTSFDDSAHPQWTRLVVEGPDRFGLLFRLARTLSDAGCSIELAYIVTPDSGVHDEFYLSEGGDRVRPETRALLEERLGAL